MENIKKEEPMCRVVQYVTDQLHREAKSKIEKIASFHFKGIFSISGFIFSSILLWPRTQTKGWHLSMICHATIPLETERYSEMLDPVKDLPSSIEDLFGHSNWLQIEVESFAIATVKINGSIVYFGLGRIYELCSSGAVRLHLASIRETSPFHFNQKLRKLVPKLLQDTRSKKYLSLSKDGCARFDWRE